MGDQDRAQKAFDESRQRLKAERLAREAGAEGEGEINPPNQSGVSAEDSKEAFEEMHSAADTISIEIEKLRSVAEERTISEN
jgi:hypothetical protein